MERRQLRKLPMTSAQTKGNMTLLDTNPCGTRKGHLNTAGILSVVEAVPIQMEMRLTSVVVALVGMLL